VQDGQYYSNGTNVIAIKHNEETVTITLPRGVYEREKVRALAKSLPVWNADEFNARIGEALVPIPPSPRMVHLGAGKVADTALTFSEQRPATPWRVSGTLVNADNTVQKGVLSVSEYMHLMQAINASEPSNTLWTIDMCTPECEALQAEAEAMMVKLQATLATLPLLEVYTVQARWLRYYSDGGMESQKPGQHGVRLAMHPNGGKAPLLYDGLAFVVGVQSKDGKHTLPGRVFVTPEGNFIASDWCQREVNKAGGIDLVSGVHTKHTLKTWLAGPAMSRHDLFGSLAERQGEQVRRYRPSAKFTGTTTVPSWKVLHHLMNKKPELLHRVKGDQLAQFDEKGICLHRVLTEAFDPSNPRKGLLVIELVDGKHLLGVLNLGHTDSDGDGYDVDTDERQRLYTFSPYSHNDNTYWDCISHTDIDINSDGEWSEYAIHECTAHCKGYIPRARAVWLLKEAPTLGIKLNYLQDTMTTYSDIVRGAY
jgi:hypothetical protein